MIESPKALKIALVVPILALLLLTAKKAYVFYAGKEVTIPIVGYDPRDLLSGHYLIYRVEYGAKNICKYSYDKKAAYVCLSPKRFYLSKPTNCETFIKGVCRGARFEAGIERFYIPQKDAPELDKLVRGGNASIVISVTGDGTAQVKNLLIDGKPWNE